MKYCEEYAALLDLFVDGELPAEEMKRVGDHLAECPGCRAYVDDALAIRAGFPDVEDTVVPEGFAQGVMERVRAASVKDEKLVELRRRGIRRWMGTAAALAACCALVILIRTGPAGGGHAAAPAGGGGEAVVYDSSNFAAEDAPEDAETAPEAGIAAQMAPAEEPTDGLLEEEGQQAARSKTVGLYNNEQVLAAAPTAGADLPAPAAVAPEAVMDDDTLEKTDALYLTAEEAGDLLDGFSVVWENAVEWCYELNEEEFRALLEALGRPEELPEAAEGPFLVVVTGPKE